MFNRIFKSVLFFSILNLFYSNVFGMEQDPAASQLGRLLASMEEFILRNNPLNIYYPPFSETQLDNYYSFFVNNKRAGNESVYSRLLKIVTDKNDIVLKEIQKAKDLVETIKGSSPDATYDVVFKKDVASNIDSLDFLSGELINSAVLPVCRFIENIKNFDQVINYLRTKYYSEKYSGTIITLMESISAVCGNISDTIDELLKVAISKSNGDTQRGLKEDLERRQKDEQEKRENEARALLAADKEREAAKEKQRIAEEAAAKARKDEEEATRRAEETRKAADAAAADKAKQEAAKKAEEERVRLKKEAEQAEKERREAEAKAAYQNFLAEQANNMAPGAKEQLSASVKGLDDVKALLEKIKNDCNAGDFKKLQTDISLESINENEKKFPGLLKSLNAYLSDATCGLFIQMFDLIKECVAGSTNNQKNGIFVSLKTSLNRVSLFCQLVNTPGIIGSRQKTEYKFGSVKFENLIKLINAYEEMCKATIVAGTQTEEDIKNAFFGKDEKSLDAAINLIKEIKEKAANAPQPDRPKPVPQPLTAPTQSGAPALPPREDSSTKALKTALSNLKESLQELKIKTELLQGKLILLKNKLS